MKTERRRRRRRATIAYIAALAVGTVVAHRKGYDIGTHTLVRCREGHMFTTIWIPGASIKALRLGWWRYQRCPVGKHWTLVAPVRNADLTDDQLREAQSHQDVRIP